MVNLFNQNRYIGDLMTELKMSPEEVYSIEGKYSLYPNAVTVIPVTVWAEPQPYKPLRVNRATGRMYVPEKAKMVRKIRDLIMQELTIAPFMNGFFPIFGETILKSHLYLPTPKAFNREEKILAEMKILRPIVTPDVDNVEKIILDSIKSFIIYDDAQLTSNITEKYYSNYPRIEIQIYFHNNPLNRVHQKTIEQRKIRWKEKLSEGDLEHVTQLLYKYSHI